MHTLTFIPAGYWKGHHVAVGKRESFKTLSYPAFFFYMFHHGLFTAVMHFLSACLWQHATYDQAVSYDAVHAFFFYPLFDIYFQREEKRVLEYGCSD